MTGPAEKVLHVDVELNLNSETVEHLGPQKPLVVEPATSVRDVFALLRERNSGSCLICRDGELVGIFTERDALRLMSGRARLDVPVETVMTRDPKVLAVGDTIGTAIRRMTEGGYRRLPIVDGRGRPVGLVRVSHLVRYLVEHFPSAVYNLPPSPDAVLQDREGP